MSRPETIRLSPEEGEAIIARLSVYAPSRSDCELLIQVIRWYFWLSAVVHEAKLSIHTLRTLLFGHRPKPSTPGAPEASADSCAQDEDVERSDKAGLEREPVELGAGPSGKPRGGHRAGTGRLGADVYEGAERVACRHEELAVGQRCPVCGQGRLYQLPPGVEIRIDGNALLRAIRYELEKLRCSACGQIFTARLPDDAGEEKYRPRARAVLAVSRYFLGLPFYRIASYQALVGMPLPDATQWDQIEQVANCAYVVFGHLERLAAQGELIYQDDTSVRILSLIDENLKRQAAAEARGLLQPTARTGMHTTALVVKVGERTIILYYSGRNHAGENLTALLEQREAGREKPLVMSDALASNTAHDAEVIQCHCLAHGRRKFRDLEDVFPAECAVVLEALKQVYDHDEEARDTQMSPPERLAYHQRLSGPIMDGLHQWLERQFDERLVEPNSSLGKAISYMRGHWQTLTRFLTLPGAPLDTNLVEQALKLFIRQRKNSLFYRTEHSAYIASVLTSLIATCLHAGVNALDYLVALQEHRAAVFADPSAWLPWTYQASRAPP
jgi:transposase